MIAVIFNMFLLPPDYKPLEGRDHPSLRHYVFTKNTIKHIY